MHLIRLLLVIIQIYLCCTIAIEDSVNNEEEKIWKMLIYRGWGEISNLLPNANEEEILYKISKKTVYSIDEIHNATRVLSNIYALLLEDIYGYFHGICYKCIEENKEGDYVLTEFKKLSKSISMFEPLFQCMTDALEYLDSHCATLDSLSESRNYYKQFNDFILDENLQMLKNKRSKYCDPINEKLLEIKNYHFTPRLYGLFNFPDLKPFVKKYTDQLYSLFDDNNKYNPNPYHPTMEEKVQEGVQKFCKDFGFDLLQKN